MKKTLRVVHNHKLSPKYARIKCVYELAHPRTPYDLIIADLYEKGKNATQILVELECAESTVYRALHRVRMFEELERKRIKARFYKDSASIHREMLWARKDLNTSAYKLYYNLICSYHYGREYSSDHDVHRVIPGLVNRSQREKALRQLNSLEVKLESCTKKVRVFDYVRYDEKGYQFKLSHNALPYYDPYYYILELMGLHGCDE